MAGLQEWHVADDDRLIVQAKLLYRGPNRWSALPVHEVEVDAGSLAEWSPRSDAPAMGRIGGWRERILAHHDDTHLLASMELRARWPDFDFHRHDLAG